MFETVKCTPANRVQPGSGSNSSSEEILRLVVREEVREMGERERKRYKRQKSFVVKGLDVPETGAHNEFRNSFFACSREVVSENYKVDMGDIHCCIRYCIELKFQMMKLGKIYRLILNI